MVDRNVARSGGSSATGADERPRGKRGCVGTAGEEKMKEWGGGGGGGGDGRCLF
jgi:hypothetical protein